MVIIITIFSINKMTMMMMTYVNASIEAGSVVSFDNLSSINL